MKKEEKEIDRFNKKQKILLVIIILLFIIMYTSNIYYILNDKISVFDTDDITLSVVIYFLACTGIVITFMYLLNTIADYKKIYYDEQLNQKQIELLSQRKKILEENSKIYLENHEKQEMILNDIYQKIMQGQDIYFEDYETIDQYHMKYCDNIYVDTLLYSKSLYALEKNILFDVDVIYEGETIDDIDMNTILFNLIDNAFEATILTDEKKVSLKIREVKGIVYIFISNTKKKEIINLHKTSKKDKNNHGLGIKIIEDIIKDYQGKIEYQDNEAVMNIQMTLFNKRG